MIVSAAVDAQAQSITYRYDEFGRLIGSTFSGGVNNGRQTATCFDAVGNRMRYDATAAVPAACGAGLSITPSAQGLEGGRQPSPSEKSDRLRRSSRYPMQPSMERLSPARTIQRRQEP
ncbi:hypothetical protein H3Z74_11025 [Sphingomonas alpina]|uniref:RHS repeat protein n=1 Tax=Sphingomonas alpina TaxID=653931 RepID=A0A7H0LPK9_9SPHN|nr:hypothetical protein H3Z74_11025 [Sphingomonas alpina]